VGRLALPYALLVGAIRGVRFDAVDGALVAGASLAVSFGVVGAIAVARQLGWQRPAALTSVSLGACVLVGGLLVWSLPIGIAVAIVTATLGFIAHGLSRRAPA